MHKVVLVMSESEVKSNVAQRSAATHDVMAVDEDLELVQKKEPLYGWRIFKF